MGVVNEFIGVPDNVLDKVKVSMGAMIAGLMSLLVGLLGSKDSLAVFIVIKIGFLFWL
jgi:hypothetical protein